MTDRAAKSKSDLGVRTASAIVMVAVAGTALWYGEPLWGIFILVVGLVCFFEFAALIFKATPSLIFRTFGIAGAFLYVFFAILELLGKRSGWTGPSDDVGPLSVIIVLGIVICTDIGAYFTGRGVGGPKIAPSISPNKTWAGLVGGMIAASIWSIFAVSYFMSFEDLNWFSEALSRNWFYAMVTGALLAIVAQIGDFFQSWLKRKAKVKDSSNLIPGHGGVFDRADGMLAVLFVTTFFPPGNPI